MLFYAGWMCVLTASDFPSFIFVSVVLLLFCSILVKSSSVSCGSGGGSGGVVYVMMEKLLVAVIHGQQKKPNHFCLCQSAASSLALARVSLYYLSNTKIKRKFQTNSEKCNKYAMHKGTTRAIDGIYCTYITDLQRSSEYETHTKTHRHTHAHTPAHPHTFIKCSEWMRCDEKTKQRKLWLLNFNEAIKIR